MKAFETPKNALRLLLACACVLASLTLAACSSSSAQNVRSTPSQAAEQELDTSNFLVVIEDEPDTVDFQRTTIFYTIATNVFNRLVEMDTDAYGNVSVIPSLAESWNVSEDGRVYTFHLREDVKFSNGSPLTASDVQYSFTRLLAHPDSCNRDIVEPIMGAEKLEKGETDTLEGFQVLGDYDFSITLDQPFEAFLVCLSTPGASIMDEESVTAAGDRFGMDPDYTIGTGSFILRKWVPEQGMLLTANKDCWEGAPQCEGLDMRFVTEPEEVRMLFENDVLDIMDLDDLGSSAEYFIHGDIYQNRLFQVQRIAITYIALNESVKPLDDTRVRKALQLALSRPTLLNAVYSGLGSVENGIFPHGLIGFNPSLPEIPYSPDEAKELLAQAGYPDGFDMTFSVKSSSTQWEMTLVRLAVAMWEDIGVRASIEVLDESEFMNLRKSGKLPCYTAMWTADFDDPDNFIYTFFGSRETTTFRSLCYQREDIMKRVRQARTITDPSKRIREYQDLERIIVQDDAAWIPLFSRLHTYVRSERVERIYSAWNGSVKNRYRDVAIKEAP